MFERPFVVADIGSNFRGSLELALRQVEAAKETGADAVKFQLYTGAELHGPFSGSLVYELPRDWIPKLKEHADKVGIEFMCTFFSPESVGRFDHLVKRHRVASSDMKYVQLLDAIKKTGKPVIVSTGGAHYSEVEWLSSFFGFYKLTILECVMNYPASPEDYNLHFLDKQGEEGPVGISDHTVTGEVSLLAARMGATVFERHFDAFMGRNNVDDACYVFTDVDCESTPDSCVSCGPTHMKDWITRLHRAASYPKDGLKRPENQHMAQLRWRRRLIVTKDISAGDRLVFGDNFGAFRSLIDDTRGGPPETWQAYECRTVKVPMKTGQGLWYKDIEGE